VIIFVGLATDFDDLRTTIVHDFGPVQPVQGVGQDAFWDPEGKLLAARGNKYFVAAELSGMGLHRQRRPTNLAVQATPDGDARQDLTPSLRRPASQLTHFSGVTGTVRNDSGVSGRIIG
jgi:hypothetical protein